MTVSYLCYAKQMAVTTHNFKIAITMCSILLVIESIVLGSGIDYPNYCYCILTKRVLFNFAFGISDKFKQ